MHHVTTNPLPKVLTTLEKFECSKFRRFVRKSEKTHTDIVHRTEFALLNIFEFECQAKLNEFSNHEGRSEFHKSNTYSK